LRRQALAEIAGREFRHAVSVALDWAMDWAMDWRSSSSSGA
jgi:hypothetical protein